MHKNQPAFWSLRQGVYFELLLELLKCLYVLFELLLLALRRRGSLALSAYYANWSKADTKKVQKMKYWMRLYAEFSAPF